MFEDFLPEISARLQHEYGMRPVAKYLRKGKCPGCDHKSLWTWEDKPFVVQCERLNNCGYSAHTKDLFSDLFESWTDRFQVPEQAKPIEQQNPHAAAEAYLQMMRGFELAKVKGLFTQEHYFDQSADHGRGAATATVRFLVGTTFWERLIDKPARFGKKKANFKLGGTYAGQWWSMPDLSFADAGPNTEAAPAPADLWLVEGIFDAIALAHHGIAAVALMSCNNYPGIALDALQAQLQRQGGTVKAPRLVLALDADKAGQDFTRKHAKKMREAGWVVTAAQPPHGKKKSDWNDLHLAGKLSEDDIKEYLYHGALLLAATAQDKALLIYNHSGRAEFELTHSNRLYWFKLDVDRYRKRREELERDVEDGHREPMADDDLRDLALSESGTLQPIANCLPQALYYQRNEITKEAWYYFSVAFPHDGGTIKGSFTSGHLTSASEFKKQLLHMAPGAMYSGNSVQLERMMLRQLDNIKVVQTVDYIGYSMLHKVYILGQVAVRDGAVQACNAEDYFDFQKLSIKSLQGSIGLTINTEPSPRAKAWGQTLWSAFGPKGYVALAFWFGSLFAEQVRAEHQSFPFLEIVGEPGSGKTTLISFMWKLFGRDYEGFDPSKSTNAGRMRTFTQVSNLPIVLIESDRETKTGNTAHIKSFDWDELKDAYNGNSIRTTGVKTGGNETYDPPFRASIVISQNNAVAASQPIMERICHMTFDTKGFTPESYEAAKALEKTDIADVSNFILQALKLEAEVMDTITTQTDTQMTHLLTLEGVHKPRIAKNHGQLMAMCLALRKLVRVSDAQFDQVKQQVEAMARERQLAINSDHPLVAEFWESVEYLDALGKTTVRGDVDYQPLLNHSRDPDLVAINLNEFIELAAQHRQQIPLLSDLKKVLKTSKRYAWTAIKDVSSAIHVRKSNTAMPDTPKTVHCWVFKKPGRKSGR